MDKAEHQEPQHARIVLTCSLAAVVAKHQGDAGTEQGRENRDEFHLEECECNPPDCPVGSGEIHVRERILIGVGVHGERLDIHHQNAQNGKSAQRVDRRKAFQLWCGSCHSGSPVLSSGHSYRNFMPRNGIVY